jgi:hypothetical protein
MEDTALVLFCIFYYFLNWVIFCICWNAGAFLWQQRCGQLAITVSPPITLAVPTWVSSKCHCVKLHTHQQVSNSGGGTLSFLFTYQQYNLFYISNRVSRRLLGRSVYWLGPYCSDVGGPSPQNQLAVPSSDHIESLPIFGSSLPDDEVKRPMN